MRGLTRSAFSVLTAGCRWCCAAAHRHGHSCRLLHPPPPRCLNRCLSLQIFCLDFSPDLTKMVTASGDGLLKVWNINVVGGWGGNGPRGRQPWRCCFRLACHCAPVRTAILLPPDLQRYHMDEDPKVHAPGRTCLPCCHFEFHPQCGLLFSHLLTYALATARPQVLLSTGLSLLPGQCYSRLSWGPDGMIAGACGHNLHFIDARTGEVVDRVNDAHDAEVRLWPVARGGG